MSFDLHLIASSTTPTGQAFVERARIALANVGATQPHDDEVVASDGLGFEAYGLCDADDVPSVMFALRSLSPATIRVVYAVAEATQCFVVGFDDEGALRTPSNTGEPPADDFPAISSVADEAAFAKCIAPSFDVWSDYRDQIMTPPKSSGFGSFLGRLVGRKP